MIYLMSDVHSHYGEFLKMMDTIEFDKKEDKLIIIGDILDRGSEPFEIFFCVKKMVEEGYCNLIKGNHEYFTQMWIEGRLNDRRFISYGGETTLASLKHMSQEKLQDIYDFICDLPYYIQMHIPEFGDSIITHTGIDVERVCYHHNGLIDVKKSIDEAVSANEISYLVSNDLHYMTREDMKKFDKYIICGHVPTMRLDRGCGQKPSSRIYKCPYYMDIDCGNGHRGEGGYLGCYRIDDGREWYV